MAQIIIVNENDDVIGQREFGTLVSKDIYRVSALWITNSKKEILLARRAFTKKQDPGKWGPAVAGTLEEGETYEENIIKESEEELGIKGINPEKGHKTRFPGRYNYFCQWFLLKIDKEVSEFEIQKEEVEEVKWFSEKELSQRIESNPEEFLISMKKIAKLFIGR